MNTVQSNDANQKSLLYEIKELPNCYQLENNYTLPIVSEFVKIQLGVSKFNIIYFRCKFTFLAFFATMLNFWTVRWPRGQIADNIF